MHENSQVGQGGDSAPTPSPGTHVEYAAVPRGGKVENAVNSSSVRWGRAYLCCFPFDIYVSLEQPPPYAIEVAGQIVTVYFPFRSHASPSEGSPQLDPERIPYREGTFAPASRDAIPISLAAVQNMSSNSGVADCIRLDLADLATTDLKAVGAEKDVRDILFSFARLVRWVTGQWWVGMDKLFENSLVRNVFTINEKGERVGVFVGIRSVFRHFGFEKPLDAATFKWVCEAIAGGQHPPPYRDIVYDAIYWYARRDYRRVVLDAAVACEMIRDALVEGVSRTMGVSARKVGKSLIGDDVREHLDNGFPEGYNLSFSAANSEAYQAVSQLWIARGNIAHGRPPIIRDGATSRTPTEDDYRRWLLACFDLVRWYEGLNWDDFPAVGAEAKI